MSRINNQKDTSENPNRKNSIYLINIIFLCSLTMFALAFALIVFFRLRTHGTDGVRQLYSKGQIEKIEETAAENARNELLLEIQSSLESGRSTTQMLREIFDDSIVVVSGGRYYFYPIAEDVERNPLKTGAIKVSDGRVTYGGEGQSVKIRHGILLSDDNGKIDWSRLADSGIEEVTVSAGTLEENRFFPDQQFERNCRYAVEKGKRVTLSLEVKGPAGQDAVSEAMDVVRAVTDLYGFRTLSLEQADEEALLSPRADQGSTETEAQADEDEESGTEGAIDPVLVLRIHTVEELSDDGKDREKWTASVKEMCAAAGAEGIHPVIGTGLLTSAAQIDMSSLADYDRWLIDHEETPSYPYSFSFWEYSAEGGMEGVPGEAILYVRVEVSDHPEED